jgi:hypothetical protein
VLPLLPEDQQRLDNLTAQINELLARAAVGGLRAGCACVRASVGAQAAVGK